MGCAQKAFMTQYTASTSSFIVFPLGNVLPIHTQHGLSTVELPLLLKVPIHHLLMQSALQLQSSKASPRTSL